MCHSVPSGRTDRAPPGKMTAASFSPMLSGCFLVLLIWAGCTPVDGLVAEQLDVQPATTTDAVHGDSAFMKFACGDTLHNCMYICEVCHNLYGGPTMDCLSALVSHVCLSNFENAMASLNSTDWCIWDNVKSSYSNLSNCTENISDCLRIPWPNPLVERTFVDIHSRFFKDCPSEELTDPPPAIIFALVITPICLIPVMVSLVVFKTKNGDGSS